MNTHWFTLRLSGQAAEDEAFADALYSDSRDVVIGCTNGVVSASFHREATSLREAILSGIESVHKADPSVRVIALELDEGGTIDEAFAA